MVISNSYVSGAIASELLIAPTDLNEFANIQGHTLSQLTSAAMQTSTNTA